VKEILGIIPARYASTRFPGKPLAPIRKKPMVQWVYERARAELDHVVVATDDQRIIDAVEGFGGKAVMTAEHHKTGTDRCREAYELYSGDSGQSFSHVINIQGDEPLIRDDQFREIMSCFDRPGTDIATLIKTFENNEEVSNPNNVKVVTDTRGRALYFSRSIIPYIRDADPSDWLSKHTFYKHIGLYAFRSDILLRITNLSSSGLERAESLEQLRWLEHGYTIQTAISNYTSIGIDTPDDLEKIGRLLD
jgi:3-deoxy-manno-octulosonate cytidylyltransferase (CMP-KDO synthetase)